MNMSQSQTSFCSESREEFHPEQHLSISIYTTQYLWNRYSVKYLGLHLKKKIIRKLLFHIQVSAHVPSYVISIFLFLHDTHEVLDTLKFSMDEPLNSHLFQLLYWPVNAPPASAIPSELPRAAACMPGVRRTPCLKTAEKQTINNQKTVTLWKW